jgi:hypothetical protein
MCDVGDSHRGPSERVQRALGWMPPERRYVGPVPSCICGAHFDYPIDRLGRVDYDNPFCPRGELCPARVTHDDNGR